MDLISSLNFTSSFIFALSIIHPLALVGVAKASSGLLLPLDQIY
ncbi:hypothetical protein [Proteus terrae]